MSRPTRHRVLVVDDNSDAADTLALLLDFSGYEARAVHDGRGALDLFTTWQPAVVISDINMPVMNGYHLAQAIRKTAPGRQTLLIALTARNALEDMRKAERAGFDLFLPKPLAGDDIVRAVRSMLGDPHGR